MPLEFASFSDLSDLRDELRTKLAQEGRRRQRVVESVERVDRKVMAILRAGKHYVVDFVFWPSPHQERLIKSGF